MNNKAHLRPKDYDSNGDIIPMSWKEENDMIPVGTTVHINPEDIKWTNERPIIFTITPDVTGRCEVHTVDKRAIEPRYFCNTNEVIDCMAVLTERYNDKGYAVLFEVN